MAVDLYALVFHAIDAIFWIRLLCLEEGWCPIYLIHRMISCLMLH